MICFIIGQLNSIGNDTLSVGKKTNNKIHFECFINLHASMDVYGVSVVE